MMKYGLCVLLAAPLAMLAGCGSDEASMPALQPVNPEAAVFWDRQTTETAALLGDIVAQFNATAPPLPIKVETTGDYGEIYQKVMASTQAGQLPAMAVSYESMTTQYRTSGVAVALDDYINDPETGLSSQELADFFPAVLESNRFAEHGGATLSFPFTKSVLMLYANHRVLREAGLEAPPRTWDAFLTQCRTIKEKTGKHAYAISVDCSTISGMIFSMGGHVEKNGVLQYDQPAAMQAFELLETLIKEDLAYQIAARTFDDEVAFAGDQIAFTLRTSAGSANMATAMGGKNDDWSMNPLPQSNPDAPGTVLFGPNVTLFNVGEDQVASAWAFTRYFTSPEVMKTWSLATGYLPIRKSLADDPEMRAYWEAWPSNRAPYDCLPFARTEPNVTNWQIIRKLVEQAESAVLAGLKGGREAAQSLQLEAQAFMPAPDPTVGQG